MLTRRHALTAFAALAVAPTAIANTRKTDALTRAILANPIRTMDLPPGADAVATIHGMFPQLIEQNFASRTSKGISRLLAGLSADELHDLAAVYNATTDSQGRLLDLLALRLSGRDLGQLTPYFGYGPVYEAVWRSAPDKSNEFAQYAIADVSSAGPVAWQDAKVGMTTNASPNVGMTIQQIYLTYRTSVVGGMAVNAALYETAMYSSRHLVFVYGIGYGIGSAVSQVIQTYAPSLHNAIGSGIYSIVNSVTYATTATLGPAQATASTSFGMSSSVSGMISSTGGDYGVCNAWSSYAGGGGGGCPTCYFEIF